MFLKDHYEYYIDCYVNALLDPDITLLVIGILLAFLLGFAMGANDVSNAFGTSVGSGSLSLTLAYILASIFETLGAVLLGTVGYCNREKKYDPGGKVVDTMRKGIFDINLYEKEAELLIIGQVAILGGCSLWLIISTIFDMPVSSTHSLVGAVLGFAIYTKGSIGVQLWPLLEIISSWVISPFFSGTISLIVYMTIDHVILRAVWFGFLGINEKPPIWASLLITFFVSLAAAIAGAFFLVPLIAKKSEDIKRPLRMCAVVSTSSSTIEVWSPRTQPKQHLKNRKRKSAGGEDIDSNASDVEYLANKRENFMNKLESELFHIGRKSKQENEDKYQVDLVSSQATLVPTQPRTRGFKGLIQWLMPDRNVKINYKLFHLFSWLQIMTACFAGFAHGANDVAPLATLINLHRDGDVLQKQSVSVDVTLFGVFAICSGLWILGHRVIETVGKNMTKINSINGFSMELGTGVTVVLASYIGLPVGAVVIVGWFQSEEKVNLSVFRNIVISWFITLPVSGGFTALIMAIFSALGLI